MAGEDLPLGRRIQVKSNDLDRWCRRHLGAGVERVLFSAGHLSTVLGVELASGTQVVVKIRPHAERLRGCAAAHRRLFELGFPCPEPLVDLEPLSGFSASAEAMVTGGDPYPSTGRAPAPFAAALARLVSFAPRPSEIPTLAPPPPWMRPDLDIQELWPAPDDRDLDLNVAGGPDWLDHAARVARRLAASASRAIVGHGDFYTGNLRWLGDRLLAVWDWDSVVAMPEAAIAGLAAAVYPQWNEAGTEATVGETAAFLDAYQQERGGGFTDSELSEAWAAGLWVRCFDAKVQSASEGGAKSLTEAEAIERCRRVEGF